MLKNKRLSIYQIWLIWNLNILKKKWLDDTESSYNLMWRRDVLTSFNGDIFLNAKDYIIMHHIRDYLLF